MKKMSRTQPLCHPPRTTKTTTTSHLSLQMLRSFVGDKSGFSESDLSTCLRQSGFLVELAAERLMTGQYQPSQKRFVQTPYKNDITEATSASSMLVTTPSENGRTTQQLSSPSRPSTLLVQETSQQVKNLSPPSPSATTHSTLSSTSSSTRTSSVLVTPAAYHTTGKMHPWKDTSWLLCQRWISDGINLSRSGSCRYQEELETMAHTATDTTTTTATTGSTNTSTCHGVLRFRSRHMQGSFPKHLTMVLLPLLQDDLIHLEATTLMEERNLCIGAHVPFSLT
jgi:hypothetical protein